MKLAVWLYVCLCACLCGRNVSASPVVGETVPCVTRVSSDSVLTREQRARVWVRKTDNTQWLIGDASCIQYDRDNAQKLAEVKLTYAKIKLENVNLRLELDKRVQQLFQWEKVRYPLWLEQERMLRQNLAITTEQVSLWRATADRYKNMKMYRPWYEHPIFVATATAVITAGVFTFASWASGGFKTP